jgi:3-deoxy-D-glycero-D-galacto-nononate 9-phosphate synthase
LEKRKSSLNPNVESTRLKLERSVAAARSIKKGELINESDICLLSPGHGFKWREKDNVVGKLAGQDIPEGEIITMNMIS